MAITRILTALLLLSPIQAWCAYDADEIKENISNNPTLFKVTEWKTSDNNSWHATTSLKRVKISVNKDKAKFIAPFINPKQMKTGKSLCEEFGAIATKSIDKASRDLIKETIRKATTRHRIVFITLNDVKFSVIPKLIGVVVSLHCSAIAT